jgi:hypothetical protein
METRRPFEPFGRVNIPPLTDETANYEASKWSQVDQFWDITMYQTAPSSGRPVDMSSAVLTLSQLKTQRDWDEVMEEVLCDRAELWDRMATR